MSTGRYAEHTEVTPDRSRAEIERTLTRYGATRFLFGYDEHHSVVSFEQYGRRVRFELPLPLEDEFYFTPQHRLRSASAQREARAQAIRQQWRALALVIKAKLEAVEAGIVEWETEFLGHIVLPDNSLVGEWIQPQLEAVYRTGSMPALLPGVPSSTTAVTIRRANAPAVDTDHD